MPDNTASIFSNMKKETNKTTEARLLELLKRVLPKATRDPRLAGKIYDAVAQELQATTRAAAFEKLCQRIELPNLEPATVAEVQRQLTDAFGDGDVTLKANRKGKSLAVEIALPDGTQFTHEIKVRPVAPDGAGDDGEAPPKFAPFPVCLPGDTELVWFMAKRENLTPEEAGIALTRLSDEFWASKTGQKLLRDRVERSFPEFVARVPAAMLGEVGLKRHYKTPEPLKVLRPRSGR
jgi:hypothetical protein